MAESLVVRPDQRVAPEQVDVIVDDHQRALRELSIDAASGVGEDQLLHSDASHHPGSEGNGRQVVAFVEVHPPGKRSDARALDRPDDETSGVADDAGRRPIREIGIRSGHGVAKRVREIAEARPQHDRDLWRGATASPDRGRGLFDTIEHGIRHKNH